MLALLVLLAAQPLLSDAPLDARLAGLEKQYRTFHAPVVGLSLDANIPDALDRAAVRAFLESNDGDFLAFTTAQGRPRSARDVVTMFTGQNGHGAFGGPGVAADAYRLIVLRANGASAGEVAAARADVVRALDAMHTLMTISGVPGAPARGIGTPADIAPAVVEPALTTCPDAWTRGEAWRPAGSSEAAQQGFVWRDNASKDQLIGLVLGLGALHDATWDDALIDDARKQRLRDDAAALGHALMQPVDVGAGEPIDLVIRDANGCLTEHHDLNAREIVRGDGPPIVLSESSSSRVGFNALAALAIVRTLYHVSGDPEIGAFYYDELVAARGYPAVLTSGAARIKSILLDTCLFGNCLVTNFSNVNMAWQSFHALLRAESDAGLRATYREALHGELFDNERSHAAEKLPQPYFHLVHAAFVADADATLQIARAELLAADAAPLFDPARENCDANEIANGACVALDGTLLTLAEADSFGDEPVATTLLSLAIRPHSNYEWRSDPRRVNGPGSDRMFSGTDLRIAHWFARAMQRGATNVSPAARPHPDLVMPDAGVDVDGGFVDAGVDAADAGVDAEGDAGEGEGEEGEGEEGEGEEGEGEEGEGEEGEGEEGEGEGESAPVGCKASNASPLVAVLALLLRARRFRTRDALDVTL